MMILDAIQNFWSPAPRSRRFALVGACAALYALLVLEGPWGVHSLLQKHREIRELEQQNAILAQNNKRLREHVERLRTNPDERDLEIQKKLKLHHPGQTTFMLPEPAAPAKPVRR